jgi:predicted transposase/invertase (TIGR01784 family)
METIAEKWKREGKIEGMEKKAKETAKKMLQKGFDHETVMEITGIQKEELEKLASISH